MSSMIGQRLGQYEITKLLGEGGMATVYQAYQPSMKRDVAIKIIKHSLIDNGEFIRRFEREAQTIASLSHIHILKVFDYGQHEDLVYLVMELLTGGSLARQIRRGSLPVETTIRLLEQIASALDYAHQKGIIHRDLKPQNVLLDEAGNAHLTDFGIVKLMTEMTALTQSGAAMGTPAYMAPEQWRGEPVDGRLDVYALGVMLFEMLTGVVPFTAETPASMMHAHIYQPPPPIREARPDLPAGIQQVINKALAKDRTRRYQSAGQMVLDLKAAITSQQPTVVSASQSMVETLVGEALPTDSPVSTRKPRYRAPLMGLVMAGLLLVSAVALGLLRGGGLVAPASTLTSPTSISTAAVSAALSPSVSQTQGIAVAPLPTSSPPSTATPTIPTRTPIPTRAPTLTASPTMTHTATATPTIPTATPTLHPMTFGRVAHVLEENSIEIANGLEHPLVTLKLGTIYTNSGEISWSPDGTRLVFSADPSKSVSFHSQLYVINSDGTNRIQLTYDDNNNLYGTWSPNGELIALHSNCDLRLIHPEGPLVRLVEGNRRNGFSCVQVPRWSPDSDWLAFISSAAGNAPTEIWVIRHDGQGLRQIYSGPNSGEPPDAVLAWSPDSSRIIYQLGKTSFQIDTNCFKGKPSCGTESVSPYTGSIPPSWLPNFFPQWAGEKVPRFAFIPVEIGKPIGIRAEQGESAPVVAVLQSGTTVYVRPESANSSIRIMSGFGQMGWVAGSDLGFQRLDFKGTIQLRIGPGFGHEVLGTISPLPTGESNCWATARDSTGSWLHVLCQGRQGWAEYPKEGGVADRNALVTQTDKK